VLQDQLVLQAHKATLDLLAQLAQIPLWLALQARLGPQVRKVMHLQWLVLLVLKVFKATKAFREILVQLAPLEMLALLALKAILDQLETSAQQDLLAHRVLMAVHHLFTNTKQTPIKPLERQPVVMCFGITQHKHQQQAWCLAI
jgi:hypothetical protein